MHCRKCGMVVDRIRLKWWQRLIPTGVRYYCAGCGRTFFRLMGK